MQVGSPDDVAYQLKWINQEQILARAIMFRKTAYGEYLQSLVR
jgi:glucose-1-phosphate thymidylyltransferase